jgi:hypothetical protein
VSKRAARPKAQGFCKFFAKNFLDSANFSKDFFGRFVRYQSLAREKRKNSFSKFLIRSGSKTRRSLPRLVEDSAPSVNHKTKTDPPLRRLGRRTTLVVGSPEAEDDREPLSATRDKEKLTSGDDDRIGAAAPTGFRASKSRRADEWACPRQGKRQQNDAGG